MPLPRLGFLGTGWIGRHRLAAMAATGAIEVAAIADPDPASLDEAAALAPAAARVRGLDDMAGLDGIVIATPSALHAGQSIAALAAGAAVFCQKPLGRTASEVRAVVDAAHAADRLLGVDLSYRHTAGMVAIAGLIGAGEIGEVFAVDLTFHNAYGPGKPWFFDPGQSGGGCVIDLGVHLVDLALWALGWPQVTDVTADLRHQGRPPRPGEVEDFALAGFTAGDTAVRLACSWHAHAGRDAVIEAVFYGTSGGAAFRNVAGSFYDFTADRFAGTHAVPLAGPPDDWGGRAAAAFARRLAADRSFDPAAEQFIRSAAVLDAIYRR